MDPAFTALIESTSAVAGSAAPTPGPVNLVPLPSVRLFSKVRSWVLAATVVNHGELVGRAHARSVAGRGGDEHAGRGGLQVTRPLDHLDQAEGADHVLEGLDLVVGPRDLHRHAAPRDVDHVPAKISVNCVTSARASPS